MSGVVLPFALLASMPELVLMSPHLCSVKAQAAILELLDNCGLPGVIGCMAVEQVRRGGGGWAYAVRVSSSASIGR